MVPMAYEMTQLIRRFVGFGINAGFLSLLVGD